ncbi:FHA domain-containing protein [uncultured Umboniibacter sp.]|uniref:FHA domain-containing protein n=1 Tax=uncultured Umboniibacter sp. TaxID=1798917 RepID=UPI002630CEC3|nr:FHA domain-containing protein [uncultured Umboniibacter sp.]
MPAKIGPDGKPIVVDTVPFKADYQDDDATAPYDPNADRRSPSNFDDDEATAPFSANAVGATEPMADPTRALDIEEVEVNLSGAKQTPARTFVEDDDEATQVYRVPRPSVPAASTTTESAVAPEQNSAAMLDPPVGWLVVTDGPGKGEVATIGYGQNSVGRSGARINLNFGDGGISRESHITVIYDPNARAFYVGPGTGKSLGYLNGSPILTPVAMAGGDELTLGATSLRFVALCNEGFGWD